jgi:hypothetical protein
MISVAYGLWGTEKGTLLYRMMEDLTKQVYEKIRFVDLTGKDLMELRSNPDKYIFDVIGGKQQMTIEIGEGFELNLPQQSLLFCSHTPFNDFYSMFREGNYQLSSISLLHKGATFTKPVEVDHYSYPIAYWDGHKIPKPVDFLKLVRKCRLTSRLIMVALLNSEQTSFVEGSHKPFMEKLLKDLEKYIELRYR